MSRLTVRRFCIAAACLLALVPLWLILRYASPFPVFDDWDFFYRLHKTAAAGELLSHLPAPANESRPIIPRLLALPVDRVFHGDLRGRMVVIWALMCLAAFGFWKLGKNLTGAWAALGLLVSHLYLFSNVQAENWLWANQVMFVAPLPCLAGILWLLREPGPGLRSLAISFLLATIAMWSFANGVLCWFVILGILLWRSRTPAIIAAWAFFFGLNAVFHYPVPSGAKQSTPFFMQPMQAVLYFLTLLGSPVANGDEAIAPIAGAVVLGALAWSGWLLWRTPQALPFLIVAGFGLVSCLAITAGRLSLGISLAFSSRYTTVAILVYVALAWLLAALLSRPKITWERWLAGALLLAMAIGGIWQQWRYRSPLDHNARALHFAHLCLSLPRPTEGDCAVFGSYFNLQTPLNYSMELEQMGLMRRPRLEVPPAMPVSSQVRLLSVQTKPAPEAHAWRIEGYAQSETAIPQAILLVSGGQIAAASFPNRNEPDRENFLFRAALPLAASRVQIYAYYGAGRPWTYLGDQAQP